MNWVGQARSNYFRVKDPEFFKKQCEQLDIDVRKRNDDETFFAIFPDDISNDGDFMNIFLSDDLEGFDLNASYFDEQSDDFVGFDVAGFVGSHLQEDQICVIKVIGAEGVRYLTGEAVAVDHTGKQVRVSIDDIYEKAAEVFGVDKDTISAAKY